MSIYYDIKEHIIISDTEKHDETHDVFINHIVNLGTAMLNDNATVIRLQVVTDNVKREFAGETLTGDFHEIVRAVKGASSVDAVLDYGYYEYGGLAITDGSIKWEAAPDMFDIREHLEERISKGGNEYLNGLFYSLHNRADCSETAGEVVAYGEKNGHLYTGAIESKAISALPDGVWYSPTTAVIYDEENVENIDEVAVICQEMTKFSSSDELTVNGNGISFYLNNLELKNDTELVEFAGLCHKLLKATNGECYGADELNLADLSSDDGRIVNIKIDADNGYEISIQSTDF